jgi:GNAT superfamily N-acetyltransferase
MICETIDESYSNVYPDRAVQFFKQFHSEDNILERSQVGEILIIEEDGIFVATGTLVENEILGVFVKADRQGKGYGKEIMNALENRAKTKGYSEITLSISLPSRNFYENLGYEILDERSIDVGENQYLYFWTGRKTI